LPMWARTPRPSRATIRIRSDCRGLPRAARLASRAKASLRHRIHVAPSHGCRTSTVSDFHRRITLADDSGVDEGGSLMFTFKTSDQKEVRRFRIAQFNGRTATARSAGSAVTGYVR
jgi:hypothetical protein